MSEFTCEDNWPRFGLLEPQLLLRAGLYPKETMFFFRADGWYPVKGDGDAPLGDQAAALAALNPGTTSVEDVHGNVLWRLS